MTRSLCKCHQFQACPNGCVLLHSLPGYWGKTLRKIRLNIYTSSDFDLSLDISLMKIFPTRQSCESCSRWRDFEYAPMRQPTKPPTAPWNLNMCSSKRARSNPAVTVSTATVALKTQSHNQFSSPSFCWVVRLGLFVLQLQTPQVLLVRSSIDSSARRERGQPQQRPPC